MSMKNTVPFRRAKLECIDWSLHRSISPRSRKKNVDHGLVDQRSQTIPPHDRRKQNPSESYKFRSIAFRPVSLHPLPPYPHTRSRYQGSVQPCPEFRSSSFDLLAHQTLALPLSFLLWLLAYPRRQRFAYRWRRTIR